MSHYVDDAQPALLREHDTKSAWSAFHVIGTVFDPTDVEGVAGRRSETIDLAPSQGGRVDFTLDERATTAS